MGWSTKARRHPTLLRAVLFFNLFSIAFDNVAFGSYWENSLEHDSHHHHDDYHERFDEAAIKNEEQRRHHQEEYAEYATRYAETSREHDHDRYEAMLRLDEQHDEKHETTRENHWNSRGRIPRGKQIPVIDEKRAKRFLRRRRFAAF